MLRLTRLTAAAYAAAIAAASPYLMYALRHYPASLTRQLPIFSLSPVRLVLPSSDKLFGLTPLISYSNSIGRYSIDDYAAPNPPGSLSSRTCCWRSPWRCGWQHQRESPGHAGASGYWRSR